MARVRTAHSCCTYRPLCSLCSFNRRKSALSRRFVGLRDTDPCPTCPASIPLPISIRTVNSNSETGQPPPVRIARFQTPESRRKAATQTSAEPQQPVSIREPLANAWVTGWPPRMNALRLASYRCEAPTEAGTKACLWHVGGTVTAGQADRATWY